MKKLLPLLILISACSPQRIVRRISFTRGWDPGCRIELSWVIGLAAAAVFLLIIAMHLSLKSLNKKLNP